MKKPIDLDKALDKAVKQKKKKVKVGGKTMKVEQVNVGNRSFNLGTLKL